MDEAGVKNGHAKCIILLYKDALKAVILLITQLQLHIDNKRAFKT